MTEKIKRIQVPNSIIDNKEFNNNGFYLYVILKTLCVSNHVNIYNDNLLEKLQWTQYQLKKYLKDLKEKGLITYQFGDIPKFKPLELDIRPIKHHGKNKDSYYTQVDIDTINNIIRYSKSIKIKIEKDKPQVIRDMKEKSLRLFYLYEMYYNPKYKCAFIGYDKIKNAMNINNAYIKIINKMFNKNDLVGVMIGDWRDDIEDNSRRRNPNNYIPYCNRIIKSSEQNSEENTS